MNRALLNPFEAHKLPDNLELYLENDCGHTTCMSFNKLGNVLAVGCVGGRIALWDFDTRAADQCPAVVLGDPNDPVVASEQPYRVTAVAFAAPRHGHVLLASFASARTDNAAGRIRMCETLSGRVISELLFDMPISNFVPHPSRPDFLIALPVNHLPLLIQICPGQYHISSSIYSSPLNPGTVHFFSVVNGSAIVSTDVGCRVGVSVLCPPDPLPCVNVSVEQEKDPGIKISTDGAGPSASNKPGNDQSVAPVESKSRRHSTGDITGSQPTNARRQRPETYVVAFSRRGEFILRGGPDGTVHVFAPEDRQRGDASALKTDKRSADHSQCSTILMNTFKIPGGAPIKSLTLLRTRLLVNSGDRSMRLFDTAPLLKRSEVHPGSVAIVETVAVYTEAVNRLQCRCACFSRDGDFVLGGMAGNDHRIHVWRTSDGHLQTTLEGPTEGILDILWHPVQPVIVSIGASFGGIYVWAKNFTENWSAFAPDFTELEANEEYDEAEDEFDAKDPQDDARIRAEREQAEESIVVDVESCEHSGFSSSSEDGLNGECGDDPCVTISQNGGPFFYLPAYPVPDSSFKYPIVDANGMNAEQHKERIKRQNLEERNQRQKASGRAVMSRRSNSKSTENVTPSRELDLPNGNRGEALPPDAGNLNTARNRSARRRTSKTRRGRSDDAGVASKQDIPTSQELKLADDGMRSTPESCMTKAVEGRLPDRKEEPGLGKNISKQLLQQPTVTKGTDEEDLSLRSDKNDDDVDEDSAMEPDAKRSRASHLASGSTTVVRGPGENIISGNRPPLIPTAHLEGAGR